MPEEISPIQPTPTTPTLPAQKLNPALIAAIIAVLAVAGYMAWQAYSATPQSAAPTPQASPSAQTASPSATPAITISAALKENMAAAISSKNTAALEGYMAASVHVVNTAGKNVSETPAQAVADVDFVSAGTAPWNFNLSAATLTSYKSGAYGTYFGDGTYVGKSANNYVISFGVNSAGKIATVFMAQNANLLQ